MKDTFSCWLLDVGFAEVVGVGEVEGSVVVIGAVEGLPGIMEGKACWQPAETTSKAAITKANSGLYILNLYLSILVRT